MIVSTCVATALALISYQSDETLQTRAKNALVATGFSYGKTESGKNYTILFDHPEKRKQMVYMAVQPKNTGKIVTFNFYTTVWTGREAPSEDLMRKTLSSVRKLGAFYLFKGTNNVWAIRFQAKFDATDMVDAPTADDLNVKSMKDVIYFVNAVGEEMDKSLNGEKDISS